MTQSKIAWVTGASSGIGEALAHVLSKDGWSVILSGRRTKALEAVAASLSTPSLVLPFEATDYEALPGVVERAKAWRGHIDLLVNNAGVSQRSLALDTAFETYKAIMEVDFFAPLRLTQLTAPLMVERGQGRIVAISSLAGRIGSPLRTGYCAAKHALLGYFEALRAEMEEGLRTLRDHGSARIREDRRRSQRPPGRWFDPGRLGRQHRQRNAAGDRRRADPRRRTRQ
jgi:short-subunit dehydrogenase